MNRNAKIKKMYLKRFEGVNPGITRSNAEALISEQVTAEIIQGVVEQSAVLSVGRKLPNMTSDKTRMKVLDLLPLAYWVDGDSGFKQTTNAAWANKYIHAEEIAAIIPIPEAVLEDADYDIWGEIKPLIVQAIGQKIDGAAIFGIDKPASWRAGLVPSAIAAGNVVTATNDTYEDIMGETGVIAKVESSGYFPTGHMAAVGMRAKLRGLKDADGHPLFKSDMQGATRYALDGSDMYFPMNGAFDATKAMMITGDFKQLVYSIRKDITYKVLTEATIVDPATKEVVYSLAQQDMVALRVCMRLGWEIPNPVNAMETDKAKRFPFAVYKAA